MKITSPIIPTFRDNVNEVYSIPKNFCPLAYCLICSIIQDKLKNVFRPDVPGAEGAEGVIDGRTLFKETIAMKYYQTRGTCSTGIEYEVENGVVTACRFIGGCTGNTQGVAKLVIGRKVEEVIGLLKGIQCNNGTSCPDQLARALERELGR